MINTVYNQNAESLAGEAASAFSENIKNILAKEDMAVAAISGGQSILGFFQAVKVLDDINWKKIHFFMLDERLVSLESKDSNFRQAYENLFIDLVDNKKLSWANLHPFIYKPQSGDKGIVFYNEELKQFGGKYDIVIAGAGEDGHIGALYPNHKALDDSANFITLNDSPKPPKERITSSAALVKNCEYAFLFFLGEGKREAYTNFLKEEISFRQCPAKILKAVKNLNVITDLKI